MLAVLLLLAAAGAHAGATPLVTSDPSPGAVVDRQPDRVRVVYPAPVETSFLVLDVLGPDGAPIGGGTPLVDDGNPAAVTVQLEPAQEGSYAVRHGALTEDGNVLGGGYRFDVGAPVTGAASDPGAPVREPPQALLVLGQLLILVGPVLVLGGLAVRFLALEPAWRAGGVAPPRPEAERAMAADRMRRSATNATSRWWAPVWTGLLAWLIGVPLLLVGYLVALEQPLSESGTLLGDTRAGAALIAMALAWLLAGAGLLVLRRAGGGSSLDMARALGAVPAAAAAVALGAASWSGHASTGNDRIVGIGADVLHNWGAALWLGGLAALAIWLPSARAGLAGPDRTALSAAAVVRFSTLAIVAVVVLVVTGVYRALAELPSATDLVDSGWGLALLVKLVLFALLLALGAYNRLVLHPRLERAALGLDDSERGAARLLVRTTGAEIGLGAAVMLAAAFLVVLPVP